jgi:hypothetical protein
VAGRPGSRRPQLIVTEQAPTELLRHQDFEQQVRLGAEPVWIEEELDQGKGVDQGS